MQAHLMHQFLVEPQLWALFLLLLEGLFLLKRCKRAKKSPVFTLSRYLIFTNVYINFFYQLFICVFVNNSGKFPLSCSFFSLIVIGDRFLYALATFSFCPSVKLIEYD